MTSFCVCEHHGAMRRFQQALGLEVNKASMALTQCKGEFEKWVRADGPEITSVISLLISVV